ncbi:TonB family protein [Mucilaginibacter gracilis]|uniref:TonB family protein n=1 Tax=Mucilaginibacter gracilis TaxID=423350 RepID=A0A495JBH3_9SPHI|nr:TonB family protein [Mucilaginibacter gracilis]RKR85712.1 TonB family protein [Mucilaginibacter gracilis]
MNRLLLAILVLAFSFSKANAQVQFKGGSGALTNFLSENLIYPEYSRQNCISGTVKVSFNVDESGKLSDVKIYKGTGVDLDDEAIRVIKLTSGKWMVPPGHNPAENIVLPVTFKPESERCRTTDVQSIRQAINAYRARQSLVNVVTNYYQNKYLGKVDTTKEKLITSIKDQLGFDDEYVHNILEQANAKFKQGDSEGACADWHFIKNIGSNLADALLYKNCH